MDDGTPIRLAITIDRAARTALLDFTGGRFIAHTSPGMLRLIMLLPFLVCAPAGTGPEVFGNCNAPPAVTYSAAIYCLRCLVGSDIPLNQV